MTDHIAYNLQQLLLFSATLFADGFTKLTSQNCEKLSPKILQKVIIIEWTNFCLFILGNTSWSRCCNTTDFDEQKCQLQATGRIQFCFLAFLSEIALGSYCGLLLCIFIWKEENLACSCSVSHWHHYDGPLLQC